MNKRGADKIISVYWFAILILVAGGIFMMVNVFYNHPYDIREIEADILVNKVADCISEKGYLKQNIFDGENFLLNESNFLDKCSLNFDSEEIWDVSQYYVEIDFFKNGNHENSVFNVFQGNKNWKADCKVEDDSEKLAKCLNREFFSLDENGNLYLIKILSIVGKAEKNVK